ncbi:zinc-dependent alcohol dehydrogenase family protein [Rhizobium wenxiniae]|uniref:zinc-dependent alcohol dehydrogenase family protein n=1 Tax=Rhizobium wenxiniae TaxID=1737357 RepID=UPI003C235976
MKVYELRGANGLESVVRGERPEPVPERGQILVRMKAWSLNHRDLLIVNNNYNGLVPNGSIALSDGAGEVIAVGEDVRRFRAGDRVSPTFSSSWISGPMATTDPAGFRGALVDGVLAELVICDERQAVMIPGHLSFQEATCLPCAAVTAWNALFGPRPVLSGQTVLTLGTGGVSTFAIQFANAAGARVISTSSSDEKLEVARRLGATETINYHASPEWQDEVLRLTDGRGVDHVVEVGGGGTINRSVVSTTVGGQIHMIGALSTGALNPRLLVSWKTLRGIMVGSAADHASMNRLVDFHRIQPLISDVFSFEDTVEAYRYLESGSAIGKVVIKA